MRHKRGERRKSMIQDSAVDYNRNDSLVFSTILIYSTCWVVGAPCKICIKTRSVQNLMNKETGVSRVHERWYSVRPVRLCRNKSSKASLRRCVHFGHGLPWDGRQSARKEGSIPTMGAGGISSRSLPFTQKRDIFPLLMITVALPSIAEDVSPVSFLNATRLTKGFSQNIQARV